MYQFKKKSTKITKQQNNDLKKSSFYSACLHYIGFTAGL